MSLNNRADRVLGEQILGLSSGPSPGEVERSPAEVLYVEARQLEWPCPNKELKQSGVTEIVRLFPGHMLNLRYIKTSK